MSVRRDVHNWLEEGIEDLETAIKLYELGRYAHSCFHAQQAAEKALKALIIHVHRRVERGHDLVELYELVKECLRLPCEDELAELSAFYTLARYPNAGLVRPSREIGKAQAERAIETARCVVYEVRNTIKT